MPNALSETALAIIDYAKETQFGASDFGDLLDFLSKPQSDPDLARACKEGLEHIGAVP